MKRMKSDYLLPCKCAVEKDKCPSILGIKLPRCARCLGFYTGIFVSVILILSGYRPIPENPILFIILGLLLALPTVIQGVYRRYYNGARGNYHEVFAFIAGFLVAIGGFVFALGAIPYLK